VEVMAFQAYTNIYNFMLEGTKATQSFGAFLKENSLYTPV